MRISFFACILHSVVTWNDITAETFFRATNNIAEFTNFLMYVFLQFLYLLLLFIPTTLVTASPIPIEEDGVHTPYKYGWHDGPNDGVPPGLKQLLSKLDQQKSGKEENGVHVPYSNGWHDGPNDGIPPGFKQILAKLKLSSPDMINVSDPEFEKDGVHKAYAYGWSDGPNDGIPPGFKQLLEKALKNAPKT